MILGGGSNMLFTKDWPGVVIHPKMNSFSVVEETASHAIVQADAGLVWHDFVLRTIDLNLGGLENLSLIPGNVGASPIQNIGAYGVEVKDTFYSLTGYHLEDKKFYTFSASDCQFGYRNSIFKTELKGKFIITQVRFKLQKNPILNLEYGAIKTELDVRQIHLPTIKDVSNVVCSIRSSKLPDPKIIGNSGSFFKNPEVEIAIYQALKAENSTMPGFVVSEGKIKLSAAWLIEQCNWKGYRNGDAGTYEKHALVLVNHGNAKGSEIWDLAMQIKTSVKNKFGVDIDPEVNII